MKLVKLERPELKDAHLSMALEAVIQSVQKRIDKHGREMFVSDHEGYGVLMEEVTELTDALTRNDRDGIVEELLDVAVSCVIAVASVVAGAEIVAQEESSEDAADELIEYGTEA